MDINDSKRGKESKKIRESLTEGRDIGRTNEGEREGATRRVKSKNKAESKNRRSV